MNARTTSIAIAALAALAAFSAGAADAPAPATAPPADSSSPNGGMRKPCEELKSEMAARMDAKGVKNYTLRIVSNEEAAAATGEKVVGSCDGGTQKILYKRG